SPWRARPTHHDNGVASLGCRKRTALVALPTDTAAELRDDHRLAADPQLHGLECPPSRGLRVESQRPCKGGMALVGIDRQSIACPVARARFGPGSRQPLLK